MANDIVTISGEFEVQCRMVDKSNQPLGYIIGGYAADGKWHNFLVALDVVERKEE
jgi:hypothetical protein